MLDRGNQPGRRCCLARTFAAAAQSYWLEIWPFLRREVRAWRQHAETIPDANLRYVALNAQRAKCRNLEGAVAFATLARPEYRLCSARAMAAYEAAFDYLDCLCEQPNADPIANGRQLTRALTVAVRPDSSHDDYYACHDTARDGGYLRMLVDTCRSALRSLPSYPAVSGGLRRVSSRISIYQSLNHGDASGSHHAFTQWASKEAIRHQTRGNGPDLYWWEIGAASGSSLAAFALIAAATHSTTGPSQVAAIDTTYFPWIGAANSLLDSLVDLDEDTGPGQHRLLDYYDSTEQLASRLELISREAEDRAQAIEPSHGHTLIFAAMMSFYLSRPAALAPEVRPIQRRLRQTSSGLRMPTTLVMRVRDIAETARLLTAIPETWLPDSQVAESQVAAMPLFCSIKHCEHPSCGRS